MYSYTLLFKIFFSFNFEGKQYNFQHIITYNKENNYFMLLFIENVFEILITFKKQKYTNHQR